LGRADLVPPKKPLGRRRKLAFAVALNLVVLGAVVLGLEVFGSFHAAKPTESFVASVRLDHTWPANGARYVWSWAAKNPEFGGPFWRRTNSQGWLHDTDVASKKPPGTYRVFYVGDSFTEGCVPAEDTVPVRVERYLDEAGLHPEVVNTGVWGYSPLIEYVLIRYVLAAYEPDLIVLNVDMTDDFDDWKYAQSAIYDADGLPWAVPPRDLSKSPFTETASGATKKTLATEAHMWLFKHSYFYNYLRDRAPHVDPPPQAPAPGLAQHFDWCIQNPWDDFTRTNAERTLLLVREIALLCGKLGIKLLVTAVPHWEQFSGGANGGARWSLRPIHEIERAARSGGAAYFDSYAALAPAIKGTLQPDFYWRDDMHFNPKGSRLWAEANKAALRDPALGLLPPWAYAHLK
jgi:hypothetical protein